jgi:hypothetical protein
LIEHDLFGKPLHTFPDHALIRRLGLERVALCVFGIERQIRATKKNEAAHFAITVRRIVRSDRRHALVDAARSVGERPRHLLGREIRADRERFASSNSAITLASSVSK